MNIRLAEREDIQALVGFNQAMAHETEGKKLESSILTPGVAAVFEDSNKGFYVVAEEESSVVGGLLVTFEWSDWRNKWFWWIQSVYILPNFRGRSIYSSMYAFVKKLGDERGNVCGFRLYVEKENVHAQKVYERLGMHESHYLAYEEEV
ncbi:MAG: GNAT family N-acetyltransferase [Acidobacteria bacterium]|nr:MAG: GNAT family N-acetyltransferase [Acidobacteriota bacterium]